MKRSSLKKTDFITKQAIKQSLFRSTSPSTWESWGRCLATSCWGRQWCPLFRSDPQNVSGGLLRPTASRYHDDTRQKLTSKNFRIEGTQSWKQACKRKRSELDFLSPNNDGLVMNTSNDALEIGKRRTYRIGKSAYFELNPRTTVNQKMRLGIGALVQHSLVDLASNSLGLII